MKKNDFLLLMIIAVFLTIPVTMVCQERDIKLTCPAGKQSLKAQSDYNLLYGQLSHPSSEPLIISNEFSDFPEYSCESADDFIVPDGQLWIINQIFILGYFYPQGITASVVHLKVYDNDSTLNKPANEIYSDTEVPFTSTSFGNLTITPTNPILLYSGHYWLSVQTSIPFTTGQWYIFKQDSPTILEEFYWHNPGGGLGIGCETWTKASLVPWGEPMQDWNLSFGLYGTTCPYTEVTCPPDLSITIDHPPFELTGAMPQGGTYSGPGIMNNMFYPSIAGVGTHTISYQYVSGCGWVGACSFIIIIVQNEYCPTAYAGTDETLVSGEPFIITGTAATNYSSLIWITQGDGYFDDATIINPTYLPGPLEIEAGHTTLCLFANPIPPCTEEAYDCMQLFIQPLNIIMQYPQYPDESASGIAVSTMNTLFLADDWTADTNGYVTEIHIWASYFDDMYNNSSPKDTISLQVWYDLSGIPGRISQPFYKLWSRDFSPGEYTEIVYSNNGAEKGNFYDPTNGDYYSENDSIIWAYVFHIPDSVAFMQETGTRYWLVIKTDNPQFPTLNFGWRSSLSVNGAGAVWSESGKYWNLLRYPQEHSLYPQPIDFSFLVKGYTPLEMACCFANGNCIDTTYYACVNLGGAPQGNGSQCSTNPCTQQITESCCFPDGSCEDLPPAECQLQGGISLGPETSCEVHSCSGGPSDFNLVAGNLTMPRPGYDWIDGNADITPVHLYVFDPNSLISNVDFYYSLDLVNWNKFYTDSDGFSTVRGSDNIEIGDGWCGYLLNHNIPHVYSPISFMAVPFLKTEDSLVVYSMHCQNFDPTPPSAVEFKTIGDCESIEEVWEVIATAAEENGFEMTSHTDFEKDDFKVKFVYPVNQSLGGLDDRYGKYHCSPVAAASCLFYFLLKGDEEVTGGIGPNEAGNLVELLGEECKTNQSFNESGQRLLGTTDDNFASGLTNWLNQYGEGYDVNSFYPWEPDNDDSFDDMTESFEECNDILAGATLYDKDGNVIGQHGMTMMGFHNELNDDGTYTCVFMSWGKPLYCNILPETGEIFSIVSGRLIGKMDGYTEVKPKENKNFSKDLLIPGSDTLSAIIPMPNPGHYYVKITITDDDGNKYHETIHIHRVTNDYGDAPEGVPAYINPTVIGSFPTCKELPDAGYIVHKNKSAFFGVDMDYEVKGNGECCADTFNYSYNLDETFLDGDAGLIQPGTFTIIQSQNGQPQVIACENSNTLPLGNACEDAIWGQDIDISVTNNFDQQNYTFVNVLIDWNKDGKWSGGDTCNLNQSVYVPEYVLVNFQVPYGFSGPLSSLMPPNSFITIGSQTGYVWARFSITDLPLNDNWDGSGIYDQGETEDYLFLIGTAILLSSDFGDAPDPFPTLLVNNGARHSSDGVTYLGNLIDVENDGIPDPTSLGDDLNNQPDEDGVVFSEPFTVGRTTEIKVIASVNGYLNAWIDMNGNNSWADAGDQIFIDQPLFEGINTLNVSIPGNANAGNTFARFRFNTTGGLSFNGSAGNGEVEDYMISINPADWGFVITPSSHLIAVPINVDLSGLSLSPNDVLGVFFSNPLSGEVCGGAVAWDGLNNQLIIAYGDDPTTLAKDGFEEGENIIWKVYLSASNAEIYVGAQYDPLLPNSDGKFYSNGLSALTALITQTQVLTIPKDWSGISTYIKPFDPNVEVIFSPVFNELIILYNPAGIYWPGQGVNTIGNWDVYSGYVIKVTDDVSLTVAGSEVDPRTVSLVMGWNLMPVFSQVPATSFFESLPGFVVAKGIATGEVLWPAYNIATLEHLKPGRSYHVLTTMAGSLNYPDGSDEIINQKPIAIDLCTPWNELTVSPNTHLVAIASGCLNVFEPGDYIGAFTETGICAGALKITGGDENVLMILMGDDPTTTEPEGFTENRPVSFKYWCKATGETFDLKVMYDLELDHSGMFTTNALSSITDMTIVETGINHLSQAGLHIYPNPSPGIFTIEGNGSSIKTTIYNTFGSEIYFNELNLPVKIDLSTQPKGIYFIRIETDNDLFFEKLIIQ